MARGLPCEGVSGSPSRWLALCLAFAFALGAGCRGGSDSGHPSILLFVMDTVRRSAVSAYGKNAGTTPAFDALADEGLLYDRAYAQSSWTLPSHASLFTGMLPSQHGVGVDDLAASGKLDLLAERLRAAGYQTLGLSENPWLQSDFGMTQGFEGYVALPHHDPISGRLYPRRELGPFREALQRLLEQRDPARPLFLFVNVMDAHSPYRSPEGELPDSVSREEMDRVADRFPDLFCQDLSPRQRELLRMLYLDGVGRADAKLAATRDLLARVVPGFVTVVTSDHGQQLGEHRRVGHVFTLHEEAIRVPLVVHGLPRTGPCRLSTPVELVQVGASIARWAGAEGTPGASPLPRCGEAVAGAIARSEYFDPTRGAIAREAPLLAGLRRLRARCSARDRTVGDMRTVIAPPYKLIEFGEYGPQLFDLSADPHESESLAAERPGVVSRLAEELPPGKRGASFAVAPDLSGGTEQRLRDLGYLGDDPAPAAGSAAAPERPAE